MSTVFLNLSELSYSVDCADDTRFVFQFPVGEAEVSRSGDDLVFVLENGVSITLKDFYASYTAQNMPAFEVEGVEIAGADFFAALDQPELMPAAGPEPANDSHYQEWSNMELLGGLDRRGGIDTGWQDGGRIDREGSGAGGNAEQAPQELNVLLAVSEGGTENDIREVTFTVSLSRASLGDVTVTLSNGYTLTIPAGETSASVTIPTRADDVYQQGGDVYSAAIENVSSSFALDTPMWGGESVSASVADDADVTAFSISAVDTDEAAGKVQFIVEAANAPQTDAVVTVNVGGVDYAVNFAAGQTSATLEVANPNTEDVYKDASTLTATITKVEGGNYEAVDFEGATATAKVEDTRDATFFTIEAIGGVEGDGTVSFNVQASNAPQGEATVQVKVGETVYDVALDATGAGTLTLAHGNAEDVYKDGSSVTATVTGVTGGNYEAVDFEGATATAKVEDTTDTTSFTIEAVGGEEGDGTVSFNVQASNAPQGEATVQVKVGETVYDVALDSTGAGTLTLAHGNAEDVYKDGSSVTAEITGVTGGNYEAVDFAGATATAKVEDTKDATFFTIEAIGGVEGDGTVSFKVQASNTPQGEATVQVKVGETVYDVALDATGAGTLTLAHGNAEDVYKDASSVTAEITGVTGGNYEAVDFESATATAEVKDTTDATFFTIEAIGGVEGDGTVSFNVQASNAPQGEATVQVKVGETTYDVQLDATGAGTLTLAHGNAEDVYKDASTLTATITKVEGGNYEAVDYAGATATAKVEDTTDATTFTIKAIGGVEGDGTVSFNVQASNAPQGEATVQVKVGANTYDVALDSTGAGTLTLSHGNAEDVYKDGSSIKAEITGVTGGNYEAVDFEGATATAKVEDTKDATFFTIEAIGGVEGDGTVSFNVQASNAPQGGATVQVKVGETTYDVALDSTGAGTLTLSHGNAEDVYKDGSSIKAEITGVTGGNYEAVDFEGATATAKVEDTTDATFFTIEAIGGVEGDGTVSFNVQASNAPQGEATVQVKVGANTYDVALDSTGAGTLTLSHGNAEDVYKDASTLTATITKVEGGNYEAVDYAGATATAKVEDTTDATTFTIKAIGGVEGDGTVSFNVQASNAPQGEATVQVKVGANTYDVALDSTGAGTLTLSHGNAEDVYKDGSSIKAEITGVTGGNYEAVDFEGATATAKVEDTKDATFFTIEAIGGVEGDGTVSFNVQASNAPQGGATVQVKVGETTYDVALDATGAGTLTLAHGNAEDVYKDGSSVKAEITGVTGGNYEAVDFEGATATAEVKDTTDATTFTIEAIGGVEGDGTVSFNVQASNAPQGEATVQVKVGETTYDVALDSTGAGTLTLSHGNAEDVYKDGSSVKAEITGVTGGNYEAVDFEGATATAKVEDTIQFTTASVALVQNAGGNVDVVLTLSSAPQSGTSATVTYEVNGQSYSHTFTDGATSWTHSNAVTVDADAYGTATSVSAKVTGFEGGNYEDRAFSTAEVEGSYAVDSIPVTISVELADDQESTGDSIGMTTGKVTLSAAPKESGSIELTFGNGSSQTIQLVNGRIQLQLRARQYRRRVP